MWKSRCHWKDKEEEAVQQVPHSHNNNSSSSSSSNNSCTWLVVCTISLARLRETWP